MIAWKILKKRLQPILTHPHVRTLQPYLIILLTFIAALGLFVHLIFSTPVERPDGTQKIKINPGANLQEITQVLRDQGIISYPRIFKLATILKFKSNQLKAGYFKLDQVNNIGELVELLVHAQNYTVKVTVPEGLTAQKIGYLLASKLDFSAQSFQSKINDQEFISSLPYPINSNSLEGYLYPSTYDFYKTDTPAKVIQKMTKHLFIQLSDSLLQQIENSERNLHEVLTLASLVEGECMLDAERPWVASLYLNRLKKNMRLESDPTIQYLISDGPRRLLNKDLEIDSPYNTYRYRGLPPGPINNPGLKSILAAISPAQTDYLYMVANGDGSHTFTENYQNFLKAKRKFQNIRRQVARERNNHS